MAESFANYAEKFPIMLALCFMLSSPYHAENYAGIIDAGLIQSNGDLHKVVDTSLSCLIRFVCVFIFSF